MGKGEIKGSGNYRLFYRFKRTMERMNQPDDTSANYKDLKRIKT